MQPLQFNFFEQVHKGLRPIVYDTASQRQPANFAIAEQREAAVERVQLVSILVHHPAHVEDSRMFSLIEACASTILMPGFNLRTGGSSPSRQKVDGCASCPACICRNKYLPFEFK